jgi:hypothetical protein
MFNVDPSPLLTVDRMNSVEQLRPHSLDIKVLSDMIQITNHVITYRRGRCEFQSDGEGKNRGAVAAV